MTANATAITIRRSQSVMAALNDPALVRALTRISGVDRFVVGVLYWRQGELTTRNAPHLACGLTLSQTAVERATALRNAAVTATEWSQERGLCPMQHRTLGRTGISVSLLSLGGLFVSKAGGESRQRGCDAARRALQLGVNYVDTAPSYLDSEETLGEALEGVTEPYVISTKLGGKPRPFNAQDLDHLKFSFEDSLRLLKRDRVDILMVHEPDRPGQHDWWTCWEDATGPVTEYLAELKREGLIRFTGIGGTSAYVLANICATGQFDVVLAAFNYSLLWREAAVAVIPQATRQEMGIVIGSPLQQGWLARRYEEDVNHGAAWLSPPRRDQFKALYALLDDIHMPITDVALRWVIGNPDIHTVLMGARSVHEVEMDVAAVNAGPLAPDIRQRLDEIGAMVPFRPFDEPFGCQFGNAYRGPGHA